MSNMLFNVCLFRWTTGAHTWRFRVGWYKRDAVSTWRWTFGRFAATLFALPVRGDGDE